MDLTTKGQFDKVMTMGYYVTQENGQRITQMKKPPKCVIPKGTEIFVGKLPKDIYEDKLYEIFSLAGNIFKIRIMMDFTGFTRGYAFISYFTKENANVAIKTLHNFKIDDIRIAVQRSLDNCRLYVGGIPRWVTREMVLEEMKRIVEGVQTVFMNNMPNDPRFNRGYVFVEFIDHRAAAISKRILNAGRLILWNAEIFTNWAEPEPEVDPEVMSSVQILYLNNLDVELPTIELHSFLERYINPLLISKVYKKNDYAFAHFTTRHAAEYALDTLKGISIKGRELHVQWARPPTYNKTNMARIPVNTFCTSLPFARQRNLQHFTRELSDEASAYPVFSSSVSLVENNTMAVCVNAKEEEMQYKPEFKSFQADDDC